MIISVAQALDILKDEKDISLTKCGLILSGKKNGFITKENGHLSVNRVKMLEYFCPEKKISIFDYHIRYFISMNRLYTVCKYSGIKFIRNGKGNSIHFDEYEMTKILKRFDLFN